MYNHEKYPIVIGDCYVNDEGETGILYAAELLTDKNDAIIQIEMHKGAGNYYKLNYYQFTRFWRQL